MSLYILRSYTRSGQGHVRPLEITSGLICESSQPDCPFDQKSSDGLQVQGNTGKLPACMFVYFTTACGIAGCRISFL